MKEIQLTQGLVALVDDDDFERINQFKWYALKSGQTFYAVRNMRNTEFASNGKRGIYFMHNVIMGFKGVDHVSGFGLDNQKINLRSCNQSQNNMNRTINKNQKTSKYKGVSQINGAKKWRVQIQVNRKITHLGYFTSEADAALAYDVAARKLFKEFAKLNMPEVIAF